MRVGRSGRKIVSVLRLAAKKPWAINPAYFTPVPTALYLTDMAVAVAEQRRGLGRLALADACAVARAWPASAIRLDAYDADAGAGLFYARCGYAERGRVVYRGSPLVYYELLL
jgi:GNAT superfamily N-acetyltransferase